MRIGFVHLAGPLGDGVRVAAVRQHLVTAGHQVIDAPLVNARPSMAAYPSLVAPAVIGSAALRALRGRRAHLLNELRWHTETRIALRNVRSSVEQLRERFSGVDALHAETLLPGIACWHLARDLGVPFVYDMHGIEAEEAKLSQSSVWLSWARDWESRVIRAASRVIVVSPMTAEQVKRKYGCRDEVIVVAPNGAHLHTSQASFQRPLTVVYAGNFSPFENVMMFPRTANLANGGFRFHLYGDGAQRSELLDYINGGSVEVIYCGRKSPAVIRDRLASAQVGFSGQSGGAVVDVPGYEWQYSCPTKLFEYAACGLPTVYPPGEWAPMLNELDVGVQARDTTPEAFLEALQQLTDESTWTRKAENARRMIRDRASWAAVLRPIGTLYEGRPG